MNCIRNRWWMLASAWVVCWCGACTGSYELFQPSPSVATLNQLLQSVQDPTLQVGDKVTISIFDHENISIGSINSVYNSDESTGKWLTIDNLGEINLPKIGRVKLAGYTMKEATFYLEQLFAQYIKNPVVNLKVLNHYVTILGEVNAPGRYAIDNEKVRLVELLGMAQGFTDFAHTNRVQLIRQSGGNLQQVVINLTDAGALVQQNYVLLPQDVVYVPPRRVKSLNEFAQQATPIAGIVTSIAVVVSVFLK